MQIRENVSIERHRQKSILNVTLELPQYISLQLNIEYICGWQMSVNEINL